MKRFNPSSSQMERSVQIWVILVSLAMNRQTITYLDLSMLAYGRRAQGVMDEILGNIFHYCQQNDLPLLNVLVVNGTAGSGRQGRPGWVPRGLDTDEEREAIYCEDWYDIHVPSANDFQEARDADRKSA